MIEKKGSQYRIRLLDPRLFIKYSFRTKDVGRSGGLQLILGRMKGSKKYSIQALRVSINDFYLRKRGKNPPQIIPITKRGYKEVIYINKLLSKRF